MVAVVNKAQIVKNKPNVINPVQNSKKEKLIKNGQDNDAPAEEIMFHDRDIETTNIQDDPLYPTNERERSAFDRSFANKTSNLKKFEKANIMIYTANYAYFVSAKGYMCGKIIAKEFIDGNEELINKLRKDFENGTLTPSKRIDSFIQSIRNDRGRGYRSHASLKETLAAENYANMDRESHSSNGRRGDSRSSKTSRQPEIINSDRDSNNKIKIVFYTESQYDNFGWVRANNILTVAEYNTLLSRYADYKHNKDIYPTTRFEEGVIHSFDYPNVFMYVKGTIKNPQITKIVRITENDSELVRTVRKELLKYEYKQVPLPYQNVQFIFGEGILNISRKRDCVSFQEYKRRSEREISKAVDSSDRIEQERARNPEQSENIYKKHEIKPDDRDSNVSNRSILANSLESAAQNDIERNKLTEYKNKISLIESEEQRLSEIQKQLFTKVAVDPSQRKDLQFEAKQISNRITTYYRQLLNLEATTALKNILSREKALAMKKQKQKDT